jgi:hypothetical protein
MTHKEFSHDDERTSSLSGNRVSRGIRAGWTDTTGWRDRDGLPIPDLLMVIAYLIVLRRWQNKKPFYITEHPLPDPDELNAAIPGEEWENGPDGKPSKPWKTTYVIYMVDVKPTGTLYTYEHDTFGAKLCYEQLEEAIGVMRLLRGEHVLPIVHLEKRPMKTQFGMKTRPHLQPIEWRAPVGSGPKLAQQSPPPQLIGPVTAPTATAPTPATPAAPAPAAAAAPAPAAASPASTILDHTKPVKPVTVAELIADEIPWK